MAIIQDGGKLKLKLSFNLKSTALTAILQNGGLGLKQI